MSMAMGLISYLTRDEMEKLHNGALEVLSEVGYIVNHSQARSYLQEAGCKTGDSSNIVYLPKDVVERAVSKMRRDYALTDRKGLRMPLRYSETYFGDEPVISLRNDFMVSAGGFVSRVVDLDGNRRAATLQDSIDSIRLADSLEHINLIGIPCNALDIPSDMRTVALTAELLKNTSKAGGIETWTVEDIEYITQMAVAVRGSIDELKKKPFLVGYSECKSPLSIDHTACEIFMAYIRKGLPQSMDTMPNAGVSSPATSAGALVIGLAETLFGLTLGYAIDPNAIVSIDISPCLADMANMTFPYSGADRFPLTAAANQMMREYYGRSAGCHAGKTDASYSGVQAGYEKALSILFPILAGATGIGTVGQIEGGLTFSYQQLVIDNEIVGAIKRALTGFEVNEDTMAIELIKELGPGEMYIAEPHTVEHFRKEFYYSPLLERLPYNLWDKQEIKGMEEKARHRARKLINEHKPEPLVPEVEREINRIVQHARKARGVIN